jgi:signal transduction histidine kinase
VRLGYEPDAVHVAVVDEGGRPADSSPGGGRGLMGMRERVAVYAGTLETGPSADGGFAVRARLPLPAEEP